jgi:hypothetical protein
MSETNFILKRKPSLKLAKVKKSYAIQIWNGTEGLYAVNSELRLLEIEGGDVFVDGHPIVDPQFEADGLTWSQKTADRYTSGAIHFTPDGLAFAGVVHIGTDELHSTAHYISGVTPPTVYKTKVAKTGVAGSIESGESWETGVTVTIGYEYQSEHTLPTPVIKLGGEDATTVTALTINPKTQALQLQINFDSMMAALGEQSNALWPASGKVEFSWDGESFTGSMKKYDKTTGDESKLSFTWNGQAEPVAVTLKAPRQAAPQVLTVSTLSIAELISISPEGADDLAMQMLIENMKWAMNESWLKDFFGEAKPVLEPSRIDLIKKDEGFYTGAFAPTYLGWGIANMAGTGAPKRPLSDDEKRKLKYYLYNGIARDTRYNKQNQGLYLQAFIRSAPKLKEYIADGGTKWAKNLFNAISTDAQINLMINRIVVTGDMQLATRYTNLLATLQLSEGIPVDNYATKYQELLTCKAISHIAPDIKLDNETDIMKWLPNILEKFMKEYEVKPANPTREQLVRYDMAVQLKAAEIELGGITKLSGALANTLASSQGKNIVERAQNAAVSWEQRYPKLAKVSGIFLTAAWCYGLTNAITGFKNWDKLNDLERTRVVLSTVQLFGKLVLAIPAIFEKTAWTFGKLSQISNFFSSAENAAAVGQAMAQIDRNWMARFSTYMKDCFDSAARAVKAEGTTMGKVFNNINKICRWLGVLVSAGFAALSTIDFINALKNGDSTLMDKAFTGIIACSAILETVCLVANLLFATQVFAIAGAVFAVIGLVFVLVEMFRPRPQPDTPVDVFMDNTLHPFVRGLNIEVPTDWKPQSEHAKFFVQPLTATAPA